MNMNTKRVVEVFVANELRGLAAHTACMFARDRVEYDMGPPRKSLVTFSSTFLVDVREVWIDPRSGTKDIQIDMSSKKLRFSYLLPSYFRRDFQPTGHRLDGVLWNTFIDELRATKSGKKAFLAAIDAFADAVYLDMEEFYSDKSMLNILSKSCWVFTKEGNFAGESCLVATNFISAA